MAMTDSIPRYQDIRDAVRDLFNEALNLPPDMFTVMFAIPRTAGWIAQWREMQEDEETKIARPRQIYTGAREREYVDIAHRDGRGDVPSAPKGFTSPVDPSKGGPGRNA